MSIDLDRHMGQLRAFLATVTVFALGAGAAGCASEDRSDVVISGLVSLAEEPRSDATFAEFTSWEWDEVYFFPESTPVANIADRTGVELSGGYVSGSHLLNSTLVFMNDDAVVESVQTVSAPLNFDTSHTWEPYPYPGSLEVVGATVQFASE